MTKEQAIAKGVDALKRGRRILNNRSGRDVEALGRSRSGDENSVQNLLNSLYILLDRINEKKSSGFSFSRDILEPVDLAIDTLERFA